MQQPDKAIKALWVKPDTHAKLMVRKAELRLLTVDEAIKYLLEKEKK